MLSVYAVYEAGRKSSTFSVQGIDINPGLYILDESEAALSPMRLMRLMYCIKELPEKIVEDLLS